MDSVKTFKIKASDLKNWAWGGSYLKTPLEVFKEAQICLCANRYETRYLFVNLQVFPEKNVRFISFKHLITIIDPNGSNAGNLNISGSKNSIQYDNGDYGNGPGPFGMSGENSSGYTNMDWKKATENYVDNNGFITFSCRITNYKATMDIDTMMTRLYNKCFPDGVDSQIEVLEKQKNLLEEEITRLTEQNDQTLKDFKSHQSAYSMAQIKSDSYAKDIERITKDNLQTQATLEELKKKNILLEAKLKACQAEAALQSFDPAKIRLDGYDTSAKRSLLVRLMEIQTKIANEIITDDLCTICKKNERQYAMIPCGHMSFCKECFQENSTDIKKDEPIPSVITEPAAPILPVAVPTVLTIADVSMVQKTVPVQPVAKTTTLESKKKHDLKMCPVCKSSATGCIMVKN